jgi:hypothetical protein
VVSRLRSLSVPAVPLLSTVACTVLRNLAVSSTPKEGNDAYRGGGGMFYDQLSYANIVCVRFSGRLLDRHCACPHKDFHFLARLKRGDHLQSVVTG